MEYIVDDRKVVPKMELFHIRESKVKNGIVGTFKSKVDIHVENFRKGIILVKPKD